MFFCKGVEDLPPRDPEDPDKNYDNEDDDFNEDENLEVSNFHWLGNVSGPKHQV